MKVIRIFLGFLLANLGLLGYGASTAADASHPRLVLQITVDALRGDLPKRYAHVLGDGGFRYLMEQGIDYTNAHYQHANTETIVGLFRWPPVACRLRMVWSGMSGSTANWVA